MNEPQHIGEILPGVMANIRRRRSCEFMERTQRQAAGVVGVNPAGANTGKKGRLSDKTGVLGDDVECLISKRSQTHE